MASVSVIVNNCLVVNCLVVIVPDMDGSTHLVIEYFNDHYYCYGFIIIVKCYYTMVAIMNGCHTFLIVVVVIFIQLFPISIIGLILSVVIVVIFIVVNLIPFVFLYVNYQQQHQLST